MVGRHKQLNELRNCLQKAFGNQQQVVFVTGETGIGKTTLVDEFVRQAAAAFPDMRIARGQCVEGYGGKEAYYPMLEAVGQLCRRFRSRHRRAGTVRTSANLAGAVPCAE